VEHEIKKLHTADENLREDFNRLVHLVHQLSFEIQKISDREKAERELIALKLENEMLKFERRLPRGKDD
jgi:hypothetical protein